MKLLATFSSLLLTLFIILSGTTYVIDKTTHATYLTRAAEDSNIYKGISVIAVNRLTQTSARSLGVPEEVAEKIVSDIVTEDYIKSKSSEITDQMEQVLRGESTTVSIEFSDLIAKANTAGLPINSTDVPPIEIALPQTSSDTTIKSAQNMDVLRFISYSLTIILLVISLVLAYLRLSMVGLAVSFGFSAITFIVLTLLNQLLESAAINLVELPVTIRELNSYTDTFIKTIIGDITNNYLVLAAVFAVLSTISLIGHKLLKSQRNAMLHRDTTYYRPSNQAKS